MIINQETLTKGYTVQDLAAIIHADASDTYAKYSEAYANLSALGLLEDLSNQEGYTVLKSQHVQDTFDMLYDYINEECENKLSITMNDGDIIWLETYVDIDPHEPEKEVRWIRSVSIDEYDPETGSYSTHEEYICKWDDINGFALYQSTLHEISEQYQWTIDELLTSIAESMNSSLLYARLTALVEQGELTLADLDAAIKNIPLAAGSQAMMLIEGLKDLGTNLNSSTVLRMLQRSYIAMKNTTVASNENTINWNDTDYSVTAYAGTVIKKVFATAFQVLGSILLFAGAVVIKIAGAVIMAIGYILNAVNQGLQYVAGEKAKYNPLADTHEWPVPIWQETFSRNLFNNTLNTYIRKTTNYDSKTIEAVVAMIDYLAPEITEGFVVKFASPFVNYYVWSNDEGETYSVEAYMTTLPKGVPYNMYTTSYQSLPSAPDGKFYYYPFVPVFKYNSTVSGDVLMDTLGGFGVYSKQAVLDAYSSELNFPSESKLSMTQDEMLTALANSCYCVSLIAALQLTVQPKDDLDWHYYELEYLNVGRLYNPVPLLWGSTTSKGATITGRPTSGDAYWKNALMNQPFKNPDTLNNCKDNIYAMLTNFSQIGLVIPESGIITEEVFVNSNVFANMSWTNLVNKVIESFKSFGFDFAFCNVLGALMPDEDLELIPDQDEPQSFYDKYFGNVVYESAYSGTGVGMFTPSNFRSEYELIPPNQEPGTALKTILITAAIATALVITVAASRALLKRKLRYTMSKKYSEIEHLHNAYVEGGATDSSLLLQFQKSVKRYNFIARLIGYDSLSFVNGWESGDGSSAVETVAGLPQGVEDMVNNTVAEAQNIINEQTETISQASAEIIGSVIGTPSTELSLNDIKEIIVGV